MAPDGKTPGAVARHPGVTTISKGSAILPRRGRFERERLPEPAAYFEGEGIHLVGRGAWRSGLCPFHDDGHPSLRVKIKSGAWVCMSCLTKGGDVLAFHMQRHGTDFVAAARALGAWEEGGKPDARPMRPRAFTPRDALEVVSVELNVCVIVINDARSGLTPTDSDWQRFLQAAGRIQAIALEATS